LNRGHESPSLKDIDWNGFYEWVLKTHEESNSSRILSYARKYYFVLSDPSKASIIAGLTKAKRRNVMAALANLAKYLGCYGYWKMIVKENGLRWQKRGEVEAFLSIINTDLNTVMDWLKSTIKKLPDKYAATLIFDALTGLRPSEACKSINLLINLNRRDELDRYFNNELSMLEHFKYPMFLRGTKNCYISFVPKEAINLVFKAVDGEIKRTALISALRKRDLRCQMIQLRKLYATTLREKGIPQEIIDLLQGRIGQSVFMRHYYKPYLNEVKTKVLKAIRPMVSELLSI